VKHNPAALEADLAALAGRVEGAVDPNVALLERGRIVVEAGARVDPFAVLDARGGPVLIRRDAVVQAHSLVVGPCVIGAGTHVLGGVVGHSTVGPQCRLAGEMEDSVWQGWANKRTTASWATASWGSGEPGSSHHHQRPQEQLRAGAGLGGRERARQRSNKVGSVIGAHVKTGIGTLLPTGCSIGAGSNLFGGGRFVPKRVPAFSWWDGARTSSTVSTPSSRRPRWRCAAGALPAARRGRAAPRAVRRQRRRARAPRGAGARGPRGPG